MKNRVMKAIIVDDEPHAIKVMSSLLEHYKNIKIVASYAKPEAALAEIARVKPDVIFLDIEMGYIDGLTMADLFNQQHFVDIIFVTAYAHYAVQAFDVNAIDYLLKPVQKKRLDQAIERLVTTRQARINGKDEVEPEGQHLHIVSFDHLEVRNQDGKRMLWRTKKARELFYYLWLTDDRKANKSVIIEKIFPEKDEAKALALLHTTVYQLRRGLADLGFSESIIFSQNKYRLATSLMSDLERVETLLLKGLADDKELDEIARLYKRDFLGDEAYDWALSSQHQLRNRAFTVVSGYMEQRLREGHFTFSDESLALLMYLNSLSEQGAGLIIEILSRQNRRSELVHFFNGFKILLAKELKTVPSKELLSMYDEAMLQ